jgi:hypothetical protein
MYGLINDAISNSVYIAPKNILINEHWIKTGVAASDLGSSYYPGTYVDGLMETRINLRTACLTFGTCTFQKLLHVYVIFVLTMKALSPSETSISIYETTRHNISEDSDLHTWLRFINSNTADLWTRSWTSSVHCTLEYRFKCSSPVHNTFQIVCHYMYYNMTFSRLK